MQGIRPRPARKQSAEVGGIEQQLRSDRVGDFTELGDRVWPQVHARSDGDQLRAHTLSELGDARNIDGVVVGIDGRLVDVEPIEACSTGRVVGDVPADRRRRDDDRVSRFRARHERGEVRHRTAEHADLGQPTLKNLLGEVGGDHLERFDRLETDLVLLARMAERGPIAQTRGQRRLGPRT